MTTVVANGGPSTGVALTPTAARVTPPPARPFQQMMSASSAAIVSGVEAVVTRLPGGPILAAAVRPGAGVGSPYLSPSSLSASRPEGPMGTAGAVAGGTSVGSPAGGGTNLEQVLATSADQNLYYLQIQEQMSQENRTYSTLSNVLKARHDTVKNAIGNIR
jgi:hypothetical protein